MPRENKREDLLKEMDDIKSLMSHLEDEYRKANVSEKYYQELKGKYLQKLEDIEKKLSPEKKEEKVEGNQLKPAEEKPEIKNTEKEEKPKVGILRKLFGKKSSEPQPEKVEEKKKEGELEVGEIEEMTPEVIEKLAQQVAGESGAKTEVEEVEEEIPEEREEVGKDIEIEKLRVMIDSIRDAGRATDETIRTLSESIGEIRSMIFQTDGSLKETALKLEKIEDDILEIKPKEIDKKFREINSTIETQQMLLEKLDRKSNDLAEKVNKVHEILKGIGGIENLVNLNKDIQTKIEDIKEAIKYVERLAVKTEKTYIDLSKSLEDFVVYKAKQEGLDEAVRDLIKSMDGFNSKLDSFPTKRDLEMLKGDILVIQKQVEEINKVIPTVQAKLPEPIMALRKERDDITLFLNSLEEQLKAGAISIGEYEEVKKKNLSKLAVIEKNLEETWKSIQELIEKGEIPKEEKTVEPIKTKIVKKELPKKEVSEKEQVQKEVEEVSKAEEKKEEMVDVLKKIKEKIK